ncbi:MAG: RNA methyltransferase, partial [Prevotellaceae bacterium]|nr:RNA methyltransferase [Prevotellaceae bacterium]
MRLSKNQVKYIRSLEFKKQRKAEGLFLAEGPKLVGDLLGRMRCRLLVATDEWLAIHHAVPVEEVVSVSADELARASLLKAPQQVMALFEIPTYPTDASVVHRSLCLALDEVQDPGNLGTIVRLADWFGISHL